jgi:putative aldouronate transport system permease protein
MAVLMTATIYPLLYTVFASFSDARRLLGHLGPLFAPLRPYSLDGYRLTLQNASIGLGFRNTIWYVVVGTGLSLAGTGLGAYVLSRKNFLPRKFFMKLITVTMFVSGGIIPLFLIVKGVRIYNTRWAFILPWMISSFNMIIMRTFFEGIPESMEESALLDGANDLQILCRIYVPLSTAVIAVITMYYGVGYWNSYYPSMMFHTQRQLYPLQMFLREVLIANQKASAGDLTSMAEEAYTRELVKYCTVVVSTVPILVVYPFLQRYFVKGVMIGAIKG